MHGILLIDKPKDFTSRDVVNVVCGKLNTKKVGHTGTLDPLATGVLVIGVNDGTKLIEMLTSSEKEYLAEVVLGFSTDTLDTMGKVLDENYNFSVSNSDIEKVLKNKLGLSHQEVPLYSAVSVKGKRLYEYARNNEEVILPKREVEIKDIQLVDALHEKEGKLYFSFKVVVSKGTYIRSLIRDIGEELGVLCTMSNLKRIRQGNFLLDDCIKLDEVDDTKLLSISQVVSYLPKIIVRNKELFKVKNGGFLYGDYHEEMYQVTDDKDNLLALYKLDLSHEFLRVYKMFYRGEVNEEVK